MAQLTLPHFFLDDGNHRYAALLAIGGVLGFVVALGDGGAVFGENPLSLAGFLVPIGVLYLAFALLTSRSPPVTVRGAVSGALSASALVFIIGTAGVYYELVIASEMSVTTGLLTKAVAYSTVGTLLTLPVSAGWVAGTLLSLDEPLRAVTGIGVVTVGSGVGAATLLIALHSFSGAAAGFARVLCFIAVTGAAALGYPPLRVTAMPRERSVPRDD